MLRTRFCLAPPGLGWGRRLSEAVFAGCVPVLVHDHVYPVGGRASGCGYGLLMTCVLVGACRCWCMTTCALWVGGLHMLVCI